MDKENKIFAMEMFIKGSTLMVCHKDMGIIFGMMVAAIKEI